MSTKSETDTRPLRQRGLASIFSVWLSKQTKNGKRVFQNEVAMRTAVFIANRQGEARYANATQQIKPE